MQTSPAIAIWPTFAQFCGWLFFLILFNDIFCKFLGIGEGKKK